MAVSCSRPVTDSPLVPLTDRGFAYGDGCFETMRMVNGRIPLLNWHCQRLLDSARQLGLPLQRQHLNDFLETRLKSLSREGNSDGVIKLVLTAGCGGRGYQRPLTVTPSLQASWFPWQQNRQQQLTGLALSISDIPVSQVAGLAGLKHLNRLEQVQASRLIAKGCDDCLLLDVYQRPIELTSRNLFLVKQGNLFTPDLSHGGVHGVMRQFIIEHLAPQAGLSVQVAKITLPDLHHAQEVFACNSVAGITPVRKLGLWQWSEGTITKQLQQRLDQYLLSSSKEP